MHVSPFWRWAALRTVVQTRSTCMYFEHHILQPLHFFEFGTPRFTFSRPGHYNRVALDTRRPSQRHRSADVSARQGDLRDGCPDME